MILSDSLKQDTFFNHYQTNEYIECTNLKRTLRLYILSDNVIRVRYKSSKYWGRDFSYALDPSASFKHTVHTVVETEYGIEVHTASLVIKVDRDSLLLDFVTKGEVYISSDIDISYYEHYEQGTSKISYKKRIAEGEHFYGLGDKPAHPDLRGKKFSIWCTDQYGYYSYTDPLYKSIPFYIGLHHYESYGIFIDNTYRQAHDYGAASHDILEIEIEGGELNYYFVYGPHMMDVCRNYAMLTGRPQLPPLWALGYHQCKWSYYPEEKVYEVTKRLREEKIPCDVFYLDIDYMDGFRCFTWDHTKFPNPKQLISNLKEDGFKTVVMIDPGIKVDEDYTVYKEGLKLDLYCKDGDGGYIEGKVWPGECVFPDFTNPQARQWWADLYQDLYENIGIAGIWNDMNEPALFEVPNKTFPDTVRHEYDGEQCSHRKAHNVYGMQMSRASYEGIKKYSHGNRQLLITRATYSGGQRYACAWTGDNIASWDHLSIANTQTQRLSLCGFSFVGSDIGGFIDQPTGELFTRWMALAVLHPFFRNHSSGDHGDQEPWSFGQETLDRVRTFIELRYQILPYIYTAFYQYYKEGSPILRPGYAVDQYDIHTHYRADEVMNGDHILFAPVLEEGATHKTMFFPSGRWYHYYTHATYNGNQEHTVPAPLDQVLLFVKEGAIVPHYPIQNFVGEKNITTLKLHIYHSNKNHEGLFLYEDNGSNEDYLLGKYNEVHYTYEITDDCVKITQNRSGNYKISYDQYELIFIGFDKGCKIDIDGHAYPQEAEITVSSSFKELTIR